MLVFCGCFFFLFVCANLFMVVICLWKPHVSVAVLDFCYETPGYDLGEEVWACPGHVWHSWHPLEHKVFHPNLHTDYFYPMCWSCWFCLCLWALSQIFSAYMMTQNSVMFRDWLLVNWMEMSPSWIFHILDVPPAPCGFYPLASPSFVLPDVHREHSAPLANSWESLSI